MQKMIIIISLQVIAKVFCFEKVFHSRLPCEGRDPLCGIFAITSLFIGLVLSGCSSSWKMAEQRLKTSQFVFEAPHEWMVSKNNDMTVLSMHGPTLESIMLLQRKYTDNLPYTSLSLYPWMLPHELGEVILSQLVASPKVTNVVLIDQDTAVVDSRNGVKLLVEFQIDEIAYREWIYAFFENTYLYEIRYTGTKRYYFENGLNDFHKVLNSFTLR